MHRWIPGLAICVVACGGRAPAETRPTPELPPQAGSSNSVGHGPESIPSVTVAPAAPPLHRSVGLTATPAAIDDDSAADAAVLDSLKDADPPSSLPDVSIDAGFDLTDFVDQPRVQYYLDYFQGRAHREFQIWLDRMQRYDDFARAQFVAHDLPADFVYLGLIESGYSPSAVSRSAAVGMWQFIVSTGRAYGLRADTWIDERRDPIKATEAAAAHLAYLTQQFGSPYLAAAAYNAGAGRVRRSLGSLAASTDDDDSLDLSSDDAFFSLAGANLLRAETRNYVPQLIAATILARNPEQFGFVLDSDITPFPRDSVVVDGGTGLDLIARLADTTLAAMHQLNPQLLRRITPPGAPYAVRVPAGTAARVDSAYGALPAAARHAIVKHTVRRGETVTTLSRKFHVSAALIRATNRVARSRLRSGTVLYLPVNTTIPATFLREPEVPRSTRTLVRTIVVRRGEGFNSVALRAGVSVPTLRAQNHLGRHYVLKVGQKLTVRRTVRVAPKPVRRVVRRDAADARGSAGRVE